MAPLIRILNDADAEPSAFIHAQSFETAWSMDSLSEHIMQDFCLGYVKDQGLCAFVMSRIAGDQADILTIATHPDHRGEGLARALLDAAIDTLGQAGVTRLFLEVAEDNVAAIALYRSSGFVGIGKRPAYYRRAAGRVAALSFCKDLV